MIHGFFQYARKEVAWNFNRESLQARVSSSPDRTDGFDGFLGGNKQGIMLGLGNTTQPHPWVELEGSGRISRSGCVHWCSLCCGYPTCAASPPKPFMKGNPVDSHTLLGVPCLPLALCFFQQTELGGHKSKGMSGVYETGCFTMCVGGISKSPSQQPGDSRFGYRTMVHKSCWDSSGSFSPQREETFFSVSFAASPDARFPCVNVYLFPHTLW